MRSLNVSIGCQNPSCLYAEISKLLDNFSNGSLSQIESSPDMSLRAWGSKTKKPPFIHASSPTGFSLNLETRLFSLISNAPNLAGGLTAVRVAFFGFYEILIAFQYLYFQHIP